MSKLLPIYAFLLPWLSLLWSNSVFFPIPVLAFFAKVVNVSFFLVAVGHIIFASRLKVVRGSNFSFIIALTIILGGIYSLIGFMNGYDKKNIGDLYTFINGPIMAYAVFQSNYLCERQLQIIQTTCNVLLFSLTGAVFVLLLEGLLGIPHYPAIASSWAILPLIWFILEKKYMKVFLIFSLILFSGKRSILGLGFVVSSIIPFWRKKFSLTISVLLSFLIIIPIITSVFIVLNTLPKHDISAINKLSFINPLSEKFAPIVAAGDRVEEVDAALKAHGSSLLNILVGVGNGFTYEFRVQRKNLYEKDRHNVHFTPVNYYIRYGIIFTVFYYGILITCIFRIFLRIRQEGKCRQAMAFYLMFGIISSFISFSLPLDYLFWFCLGALLRKEEKITSIA